MYMIDTDRDARKSRFHVVAEPFLQEPGLAFTGVLTADNIERAFTENGALFGQEDIFSTPIVLWAFLAQVLRGGKGGACAAAVADIATYMQQTGGVAPCGDTGDYCRARAKLDLTAVRQLAAGAARELEQDDEQTIRLQPLNSKYPSSTHPREKVTGLWPAVFRFERIG